MGRSLVRAALVPALYLVIALVQTAPLGLHLTTCIPFGNYPAPTVPRFNLWTLWWNSDRLLHGYRGYWQAPIFYPESYSFAYSEPEWLTGLFASPVWAIGDSPALAYNVVLLTAFTLNGWCGYLLLRRLHVRFWPAVWGGMIMEMLPTTADQLGVLQSTILFPIPMTLAAVRRFGESGRLWPALASALWMAACYHMSSNTALLFGPVALLGFVLLAGRRVFQPRSAAILGLAALSGGLLIGPMATVQGGILRKVEPYRPASMIAGTSAHFGTYTHMPVTNLLRRRPPDRQVATLYPGTSVLVVAAVGAWYGLRRRRLRRWTIYLVLAAAGCVLLSFGPLLGGEWLGSFLSAPYELLSRYYPGFRFARNLWRFGALAQVFLAMLVGLGLAACFGLGQRRRHGAIVGSLAVLALGLDLLATPVPLLDLGENPTHFEWVRWLRDSPPETTVIHLPMPSATMPEDFERTTYWMDCQMYHGRRMANGYAAYVPGPASLLMQVMPRFPDADSIRALQYFGIDHVLAASEWETAEHATKVEQWKKWVVPELHTADMTIYRIVGAVPGHQ
jgi:hypothetical protein